MQKLVILLIALIAVNGQFDAATVCGELNYIGDGISESGYLCLTDDKAQECFDHLDHLDAADGDESEEGSGDGKNDSISNVCEPYVDDSDAANPFQSYEFTIAYHAPYYHKDDCFTQDVNVEGIDIPEGTADYDEYVFTGGEVQEIVFSIKHDDMVPVYDCFYNNGETEFTWNCEIELSIKFGGNEQLLYGFHMTVTLPKDQTKTLTVTVIKNTVAGDCCTNELEVETVLTFCETLACDDYKYDLIVERKENIFVEHKITTKSFDYYFLEGLQLKLGAFYPKIINYDSSQAGRLMYQFQSNIALPNMKLEVISRLSESSATPAGTTRRMLLTQDQQDTANDDYKIKATSIVSVKEQSASKKSSEESDNSVLIGVLVALGCVMVLGGIGAAVYFVKSKNSKSSSAKYEETNQEPRSKLSSEDQQLKC